MKLAIKIFLLFSANCSLNGAVILDDFSQEDFVLEPSGLSSVEQTGGLNLFSLRRVGASGVGSWSVNQEASSESLNYQYDMVAGRGGSMSIFYQGQGSSLDLSEYTGIEIDVSQIMGVADVRVILGLSMFPDGVGVDIDSAGTFYYPFSNLPAGADLNSVPEIDIFFRPELGGDFSMTIDEIRLVPEPSASLLTLFSIGLFAIRRQRRRD